MAKVVKTNQLPVITDLTGANIIGLTQGGVDAQFPLANIVRNNIGSFKFTDSAPTGQLLNQSLDLIGTGPGSNPSGSYTNLLMAAGTPLVIPAPAAGNGIFNPIAKWNGSYWIPDWQEKALPVQDLAPYAKNVDVAQAKTVADKIIPLLKPDGIYFVDGLFNVGAFLNALGVWNVDQTQSRLVNGVKFATAPGYSFILTDALGFIGFAVKDNGDIISTSTPTPKTPIATTVISPTRIYTTCNDVNTASGWTPNLRGYSVDVFLDRFVILTTKKNAYWKEAKRTWHTLASRVYYDPEPSTGVARVIWNNDVDIDEKAISLTITGETVTDYPIAFTHTSSKSSLSKAKFPKIMQIGDSVTESGNAFVNWTTGNPGVSWAWVKYFFELDRIESGNGASDYNCLMIGTRSKQAFNAILGATTNAVQACAEGRSGWTTANYLTAASVGGVTNAFYDAAQVVKFSVATYLANYKTLSDDGKTRLVVGSTAGASVTDVNAYDVCTPNIVIIQLGFNDTSANYIADLTTMINKIKAEYPAMIIGLSYIDSSGTYWPENFPEWEGAYPDQDMLNQIYVKRVHEKMVGFFNAVKALENDANRIYVIPSAFIEPTAMGMPYRIQNGSGNLSNSNTFFNRLQPFSQSSAIGYHPNNICNAAWGYGVYSWVKWLCAKNYI